MLRLNYKMKKAFVFIALIFLIQSLGAQNHPRLEPLQITELVPVKIDLDKERQQIDSWCRVDTNLTFVECRNTERTVGYLVEPKDGSRIKGMIGNCSADYCHVGLREVQRTETLLAESMDKRANLVHHIHRAFVAPRFYQYYRQYVFYLNVEGDTCVQINCTDMNVQFYLDRRFVCGICDGDDTYWTATLNLSRNKLLFCSVNGPTYYYVDGHNDEPCGLYDERLFGRWWPVESRCEFKRLPVAVRKTILQQADTSSLSGYEYFIPKYWKVRKNKITNRERDKLVRFKSGKYYRVFLNDSICRGYDAKGRMLYVGNEDLGCLDKAYLSHIAGIDAMMDEIAHDLSGRGFDDFENYGCIWWVEQVGDRYVIAVIYDSPIPADYLWAYYTFDPNGRMEGVAFVQQ